MTFEAEGIDASALPAWLQPRAPDARAMRLRSVTTVALDRRRTRTAGCTALVPAALSAAARVGITMTLPELRDATGAGRTDIAAALAKMRQRGQVQASGRRRAINYLWIEKKGVAR